MLICICFNEHFIILAYYSITHYYLDIREPKLQRLEMGPPGWMVQNFNQFTGKQTILHN